MRDYGDVVGFRMGPRRLYLLSHPDHARHVLCDNQANYRKGLGLTDAEPLLGRGLLTSEGAVWNGQRRLVQQAFHGKQMEAFGASMIEAARATARRWQSHADAGTPVDVAQEMVRLTMDILGATLFRTDLSASADALSADLTVMARWAMGRMAALVRVPLALPTPRNLRAQKALHRLDQWVAETVAQHHRGGSDGGLLALLTASDDDHDDPNAHQQRRDEMLTLLLAGHETTAATLAWTWYLLARHPAVERRLHEELDGVLGEAGPSFADVPRLAYTKMVLQEVMRLYPPVWLLPRKAVAADQVGGYRIPAGADVLVSIYSMHRHPAYWQAPEVFDPTRFAAERAAQRPAYAYLPFGAGPRTCLGSRFGLMEAVLAVAVLARRYRCRAASAAPVEPEASLTLRPGGAVFMQLFERAAVGAPAYVG